MLPASYMTHDEGIDETLQDQNHDPGPAGEQVQTALTHQGEVNTAVKAFACSTCGKGFARRSDLARHGKKITHSSTTILSDASSQNVYTPV